MAYLQNRIGPFTFISIEGEPDESAPAISIDSWGGVDGADFTDEGIKGTLCRVMTVADCNDLLTAGVKIREYKALQGEGSVAIVKDGELLTDRFKVLKVTKLEGRAIATAVGNKQSAQARALLVCVWDLEACPPGG